MGTNRPGSREYRKNERAAQERHGVPIDKAGRDSIARKMNTGQFRANYDAIDWGPRIDKVAKGGELSPESPINSPKVTL